MRRFVIGDIHGCAKALRTLLESIDPQRDDELVFLGDYVDRGPDSRGVIDQLIELQQRCRVVALRGNHEIMLYGVAYGGLDAAMWLGAGGNATVTSYGGSLDKIPADHKQFLLSLRTHYETAESIFVHACYDAYRAMDDQSDEIRYWTHLGPIPPPHCSGKRVFVGHTPQPGGTVLDVGHLVCVDTYCFGTGYLTAMNVDSGELVQVDRKGHRRRVPAEALWLFCSGIIQSMRNRWKSGAPHLDAEPTESSGADTEVISNDNGSADR
ncbi:serine/threonine protein phosphatase [Stieleria sp. TO1_6]|uniref:metallophosphoesterase family protein n=1 Tax=Stieleria tagensis TaxID=2956795 RepID=UPI00209B1E98|nr:metallophosphoesterase family protein [Stieleria tagensis]MCO8121177.1 serine/threonine protein phosphatase [Stieleria tagensis]